MAGVCSGERASVVPRTACDVAEVVSPTSAPVDDSKLPERVLEGGVAYADSDLESSVGDPVVASTPPLDKEPGQQRECASSAVAELAQEPLSLGNGAPNDETDDSLLLSPVAGDADSSAEASVSHSSEESAEPTPMAAESEDVSVAPSGEAPLDVGVAAQDDAGGAANIDGGADLGQDRSCDDERSVSPVLSNLGAVKGLAAWAVESSGSEADEAADVGRDVESVDLSMALPTPQLQPPAPSSDQSLSGALVPIEASTTVVGGMRFQGLDPSKWGCSSSEEEVAKPVGVKREPVQDVGSASCVMPLAQVKREPVFLVPRPMIVVGVEKWLQPLLSLTEDIRTSAGPCNREYRVHRLVLGSGAPLVALRLLGIQYSCGGTSAAKQSSITLCRTLFGDTMKRCFATAYELNASGGLNRLSGALVAPPTEQPDCLTAFFPPYKRSSSARHAVPSFDDDCNNSYAGTHADFIAHLRRFSPKQFWIDADQALRTATTRFGGLALDDLLRECRGLKYAMSAFSAPHNIWVKDAPRITLVVCGFSQEAGGNQASAWCMDAVKNILETLLFKGPVHRIWGQPGTDGVSGILDPTAPPTFTDDGHETTAF